LSAAQENTQLVTERQSQGGFDLSPRTFEQAIQFAGYLADSTMVPKEFIGKPGNCLIAMQWGAELGLKPLQAIQNLAVINGRPSLWGDAVLALVRASPLCEWVVESDDGATATCRAKRRGEPEQARTFSVDDAKTAGLLGKQGPWTQYPKRMMAMRARGFALRDAFADVLKGLITAEEAQDYPTEQAPRDITPAKPANPLDAIAAPVVEPEVDAIEMAQANAAAQHAAAEDAEDIQVFEVVEIEEVVKPDYDTNNFWALFVPGKEPFVCPDKQAWERAYEELCDKVTNSAKLKTETRMEKLGQLRVANEPMFAKLNTEDKVLHIQFHSARKTKLMGEQA
jgi:hypothetical protein